MLEITLDKTKVEMRLSKLAEKLRDLSQPFNQVGDDLIDYFGNKVFESQGVESTGANWRKLAPATLYMRAHHRGYYAQPAEREDRILVWTGRLHRGFTKKAERAQLTISNDVEYFKYHQLGGGHLPQRKMLAINKIVLTIVKTRIEEYTQQI